MLEKGITYSLVKEENAWVLEEETGDRQALLFASRNHQTSFTNLGIVTIWEIPNDLIDLGSLGSLLNLLVRGIQSPVANVVANVVVEQRRVLRHNTNVLPKALEGHLGNILSIDEDPTALRFVEAEKQTEDGRLSTSGRADKCRLLSGMNGEAGVLKDGTVGMVPERDVLKADLASLDLERRCIGELLDLDLNTLEIEHGLHIDETLSELTVDRTEEVERQGELEDELVDHDEVTNRHGAVHDALCCQEHHDSQA